MHGTDFAAALYERHNRFLPETYNSRLSADGELPEEIRDQTEPLVDNLNAEGWSVLCKRPEGASGPQRLAIQLDGPEGQSHHMIVDQQNLAETLIQFLKGINQNKASEG